MSRSLPRMFYRLLEPCQTTHVRKSLLATKYFLPTKHPLSRSFLTSNFKMMKAIGQTEYGPASVLKLVEIPKPTPTGRDLLVKVHAVATNPVDYKVRGNRGNLTEKPQGTKIVGWDASGVVEAVGSDCHLYKVGDEVMFAGVINRPDERITGRKPKNVTHEEAAALPLTSLTAWEGLNEQLRIPIPHVFPNENENKVLLVTAGAGGVGSIAIQLAKKVFRIGKVVATASRPESVEFTKKMGADFVIDHTKDFKPQLTALGIDGVDWIFECTDLEKYFLQHVSIVKAFGGICSIVESKGPIEIGKLMGRRVTVSYELMFSRALWGVEMERQKAILDNVATLVERREIDPRATIKFSSMVKLAEAHTIQESGKSMGKIVLTADFSN